MKNLILSLTRQSVPYIKELRAYTKSVAGCILMQQLDFWFSKYPEGFYKFLTPPEQPHSNYKAGDSWQEEIGFSPDEFRTAFDLIGTRYTSKKTYLESGDKFQGKFYCSYYDRVARLTHYFRNHEVLDGALLDLISGKAAPANGQRQSLEMEIPVSRSGQRQSLEMEIPVSILYSEITSEINTEITTENNYKLNTPLTPQGEFCVIEDQIPFSDWEPENLDPENWSQENPDRNQSPLAKSEFFKEPVRKAEISCEASFSAATKKITKPKDSDFNIFCDRWNQQKPNTWAGCELSRTTGTFNPKRLRGFRKAWAEHGDRLMEKFDLACEFLRNSKWHIDNPFSIETLLVEGNITKYSDDAIARRQNPVVKSIKDMSKQEIYEMYKSYATEPATELTHSIGAA